MVRPKPRRHKLATRYFDAQFAVDTHTWPATTPDMRRAQRLTLLEKQARRDRAAKKLAGHLGIKTGALETPGAWNKPISPKLQRLIRESNILPDPSLNPLSTRTEIRNTAKAIKRMRAIFQSAQPVRPPSKGVRKHTRNQKAAQRRAGTLPPRHSNRRR